MGADGGLVALRARKRIDALAWSLLNSSHLALINKHHAPEKVL
jgi:hypothetical protein